MSSPRRVLAIAPASFGPAADEFLEAFRATAGLPELDSAVVAAPGEARDALDELGPGSVVVGSLSSDLGVELAGLAAASGLVHLEIGALADAAVGPASLRVTGGASDTAAAALRALGGRPFRPVAERSAFADALLVELAGAGADIEAVVPIEAACDDTDAALGTPLPGEVVLAIARPPWPEALCAALGSSRHAGTTLVGLGSFGRPEVDRAAQDAGLTLRFVDVLPANLLRPEELEAGVAAALADYLPHRGTVYGDLGWAAGLFVRRALLAGPLERASLVGLELSSAETGFGHGVAFDARGHNRLATKALLAWEDGRLVSARPLTGLAPYAATRRGKVMP
ncbi:MAG: hypothetical protein JWM85_294 [Acidimicrobiaceae bacterium]|jgi:hypothetical protein|nr:hypothetical protein [Acidimicrobiaceae bacterium]